MTIRARLLATYLVLTALGISLLAGYILWSFRNYFLTTAQDDLLARATAVGESIADALDRDDTRKAQSLAMRYSWSDHINIRVLDPDGHLVATSAPVHDRYVRDWKAVPGVADGLAGQPASGIEQLPGPDEIYEVRPITRDGRNLGVLRMSLRLVSFEAQFDRIIHSVEVALVIAFALCTALSIWLARGIASPIQKMRNFAVRIGGAHFGEKLEIRRSDELGQLARELNRMSERLASLDDERRGFLANVSHELRTPVSNVRLTLEALESGADEEPELRERFIRTALEETNRLALLVQDLLDLGRLDARVTMLNKELIDLPNLVRRAVDAMEGRTRAKGLHIDVEIAPLMLVGDSQRLLQVLVNILDNAIKFSPQESTIRLFARPEGSSVQIEIRDEGPGIQPVDLPHIFEPFYTADRSRKRGGTGLGLAIVHRIVEAHGGSVGAASAGGRGTTFTIRLPAAASTPVTAALKAPFTKT